MNEDRLLERVLLAHGGLGNWRRLSRIDAHFSSGGLAFASRWQSGKLLNHRIEVCPHRRCVTIHDFPTPGQIGQWRGDEVRIGSVDERPDQVRGQARKHFDNWITRFRWDDLDLLYFAGYALWNYLSFPFLLCLDGVEPRVISARGGHALLEVTFPHDFPTHCSRQFFHFDSKGLLVRHVYVAEVFGRWAAGANFCRKNDVVDGLRFYTRRRVVPSLGRTASLPFPTLVWIELDDVSIHTSESGPDLDAGRST